MIWPMPGQALKLILMLFALGVVTIVIAVVAMAVALLRPPRMTDGKAIWVLRRMSPGDLGLAFEDVHFNVRDEQTGKLLKIAGWWIPYSSSTGRCVVLLHGYADAKVGAIAWAPLWHAMGFNVLAIDLRAHGESDGVNCTAGFWERHDVAQVINQLRAERPDDTRQLVLFGVSLGAATAIATAAMRDDLSAIILESPPADFCAAAMTHMDHLGAPGGFFQTLALSLAERMAACDFGEVRPVDLLKSVPCPVMIISPTNDPMVSDDQRLAMQVALRARGRNGDDTCWSVNTGHLLAIHAEREEYEKQVRAFIKLATDGVA